MQVEFGGVPCKNDDSWTAEAWRKEIARLEREMLIASASIDEARAELAEARAELADATAKYDNLEADLRRAQNGLKEATP